MYPVAVSNMLVQFWDRVWNVATSSLSPRPASREMAKSATAYSRVSEAPFGFGEIESTGCSGRSPAL